ncbi:LysR family transcriptional regulator [Streptomyces sp. TLI_171]|uniref:LysR family transcriptional regulator n=1 Tax=Streptomyces sp. TLI_171 TaxID=1938859 RepID=UPI000C18CB62|nr:LysR family transcriptional regulator [Streptomyces sp. TLI_171]RKE17935.1 DNA-binding transcriptional LysR family regulator [Streptomyces sp. TLI_171]
MELHLLKTFVAVATAGSFSAAARELGYTQSAVSQQIALLEAELGTPLLHRRPVRATAAGVRMLDHAQLVLERMDAARAELRRMAAADRPELALAVSPLALDAVLASALAAVRAAQPRVRVRVSVLDRRAVAAEVAAGGYAVGVTDGYTAPGGPLRLGDLGPVRQVGLGEEPCAVALPADHPLRRRSHLDLAQLADAGWLDAPGIAAPLDDLRAATGLDAFPVRTGYDGLDVPALLALCAAGHGLALLPRGLAPTALPVRGPRLIHRRELLFAPSPSAPARAFIDALPRGA